MQNELIISLIVEMLVGGITKILKKIKKCLKIVFRMREKNIVYKNDKEIKEVYDELLTILPPKIDIMPKDFIFNHTPWWSAEISQISMKHREIFFKEELNDFYNGKDSYSYLGISSQTFQEIETEYNNILFFNENMIKYMTEYSQIHDRILDYEKSNAYKRFKVYASKEVKKAYEHFKVAYDNAYNTSWGGYSISKYDINTLLNNIFGNVRYDLCIK